MNRQSSAGSAFRRAATIVALLAFAARGPHLAVAAPDGSSTPLDLRHFVCPVGGKAFDQDVGYSAFPLITLPDGSWLGDSLIDVQIPSCPDNGLVILPDYDAIAGAGDNSMAYHSYTPDEIGRLPALIADPAYVSLRADGRHAQAYWLATKLGRPALERFSLLQRATWAATDPGLRRRLVERLAADGPPLIEASDLPAAKRRVLQYYLVNALRELGRFGEALALLDKVGAGSPPAPGPEAPDAMGDSDDYAARIRLAIAQKDDGRFPAELLDRRILGDICEGTLSPPYNQRTPAAAAACKTRLEREARESAETEAAITESVDLEQDPAALAARCAATSQPTRGKGLAMACDSLQRQKDEKAAAALVKDGPALAAACAATPEADQKGPLFYACISFRQALESALGDALAGDDQAWAILCPGGAEAVLEDRDSSVSGGCGSAGRVRKDREVEALLADPAKIDARCASTPRDDMPIVLFSACLERESRKRDARIEHLAGDEAAFGRDCGRFRQAIAQSPDSGDGGEEEICRNAYNLRENRKARAAAEAKGLTCWEDVIYSPDRPRCVPRAEYEAERARNLADTPLDDGFEENSSLLSAARVRAAAIVAKAKADRTYPKRRPGDRF
jgi:hypothetical protein